MTDEEYILMKMLQAKEEAEDTIQNYLKPFNELDDWFIPNNMSEEEFKQLKAKMCEPKGD